MNAPIFIGYGTLETLLKNHPGSSVYFSKCIETTPSDFPGLRKLEFFVVATIVHGDGNVHYWRFKTGAAAQHGRETDKKIEAAESRTKDAFDLLWYEINVFHPTGDGPFEPSYGKIRARNALVAFPKDYKYIDGDTDLIRYVEATDSYSLAKTEEAAA